MTPELRQQVETVYYLALQIDPTKRPSFLDEACGGNPSLRHEVESLLSAHDLKTAVSDSTSEAATKVLGGKPATLIGQSIAQYKILSLLGRGGMGEVYLVHDSKLGRNIALKLLPKSLSHDEERLKRFAREARSASALNHPNVCIIHEIGETPDGCPFIAMEHIDGMNLRQRMKQGPIPLKDAVEIARQVAAALIAAHKAGVVHRDVKPENIMLRPDGYVKVLDFGLAKLTEKYAFPSDSELPTFPVFDTQSEHLIGTVYYLSPEQAKRKAVDERTDIWSLGVVLYEMLAGRMPFSGETPSHAIVAILESQPEPLTASVDRVPEKLQRIVHKALRKNRQERYQTAGEFASALETVKQELSTGSFEVARAPRRKTDPRWRVAVLVTLAVLVAGGVVYLLTRHRETSPVASTVIESVAVLPFENTNKDANVDYLSDGMTESLINDLSQIRNLRVIGRNSAFQYRNVQKDSQTIGRELGVQAILTGRVIQHEGVFTIYVDLEDTRDKHRIWGDRFDRKALDLLAVQEEISQKIAANLSVAMTRDDRQKLTKVATQNNEAYQWYLKGRWYWNKFTKDDKQNAINSFQEAIKLDPRYALAYSGLADVYVNDSTVPLRESYRKAKAAAEQALALDASLGEAHATLGFMKTHYDIDWPGAETEFKKAIELNPNYATAHYYYAILFTVRGDFEKSLQEFEKARVLDPLSPLINSEIGAVYFFQRDYDRCIEYSNRMARQFPEFALPHVNLAWAYTEKKMYREAIAEYLQARTLSKGHSYVEATLAYTYAISGNKAEARKILKNLEQRATHENVSAMRFAVVHLGLGERDQMFQWLERAKQQLDVFLIYLRINPFFDTVRNDPKFQDFIQQLGLASR
jgi:serine/threonine-protein kinase